MKKLTIHEIADLAGVSTGTVSRVLNGRPGVSDDTRTRVEGVVGRTGYVPDAGARRLARGARQLVGVAPFSENAARSPYYSLLLDAVQETCFNHGFAARVLDPSGDDPALALCAGFVLPGVHLDDSRPRRLRARGVPVVVVGQADGVESWVDVDNAGGMRAAVAHLARLGHRRVAHLTGSPIGETTNARLAAYRAAVREAGLEEDGRLVLDGGFTDLGAYRAVRRALEGGLAFTAVAAASDEMAVGAVAALDDLGLGVPRDVSVTGFDDLPLAREGRPPLTTVRQPIRELGGRAAAMLLERLAGRPAEPVVLPTELVVRALSAAAPQNLIKHRWGHGEPPGQASSGLP